jgi:hypothetical protein
MENSWPILEYSEWKATYETLHRWVQIIGKLRLCNSPWVNHSWGSTFYVTSRGLSTSAIPLDERNLTVDFDFFNHQLIFQDSLGKYISIPLKNESVSSFYNRVQKCLFEMEIKPSFEPIPNEMADAIPFPEDEVHCTYDKEHAHRCWQVLVRVSNVLLDYRANFVGKSSPVHFFWGSFDLAVTRFSGRKAPEHPGGIPHISDEVVREAYSHEAMSCGFWPGNEIYPHAAFYAYAYPEPFEFSKAKITPPEAVYNQDLHEFLLPYETVRKSQDPRGIILSFYESAYRAAANQANWDRDILETSPHLMHLQDINRNMIAHYS